MTDSAANLLSILFGLGVFAVIMALGWRTVQKRRILRVQGADGHETLIIAGEDDEISSIVTETTQTTHPEPAPGVADTGVADPIPAPEFGRKPV